MAVFTMLAEGLHRLFRLSENPSAPDLPPGPPSASLQLDLPTFEKALRSGGRGTAPGMSWWRYEHLRVVLQYTSESAHLLRLAQCIIDGNVPPAVLGLLV